MRILIVGASGALGRELVAQALARGHRVTALVRVPERFELRHPNLTVVAGDVLDPAAVEAAVAGQEAVISALGHKRWMIPTDILSTGTANVLAAMARHGVRRFVCVTSLGVGDSWWRMGLYYTLFVLPVILQFYFWDKHRQEKIVRASGLDWTIVRPGALTHGRARGRPGGAAPRSATRSGRFGSHAPTSPASCSTSWPTRTTCARRWPSPGEPAVNPPPPFA